MERSFLCHVHGHVSWCSLPACYPPVAVWCEEEGLTGYLCVWCAGLFQREQAPVRTTPTVPTVLLWQKQNWTYWQESMASNAWTSCLTVGRGEPCKGSFMMGWERWGWGVAMKAMCSSYMGGRGGGGELQWKQCVVVMWSKWGWGVMKGHAMTHHRWTWTFCCSGNGEQ